MIAGSSLLGVHVCTYIASCLQWLEDISPADVLQGFPMAGPDG